MMKICVKYIDNVNCEKCRCNDLKVMCNLPVTSLAVPPLRLERKGSGERSIHDLYTLQL